MLVDRKVVVAALLVETDGCAELRQELDKDARVPGEPKRPCRLRAEEELRELAHPVRREPAADALARHEPDSGGLLAHLRKQFRVRLETELRDEAKSADEAKGILAEALGGDSPQASCLEVGPAAERVDELAGVEPAGNCVDGEVATAHVVLDRQRRVGDDLEVVPAGAGGDLLARRSELDPGACQLPDPAIARMKAESNEAVGDDEILDASVRCECRAKPIGVETGNEKVGVLRIEPEQFIADSATDEIGVEPQRTHVVLDFLAHRAILARLEDRYGLDLDKGAGRELRHLDRRPCRRLLTDVLCVDGVHRLEVVEVLEEDGRLHEPVEPAAGLLEDRLEV